MATAKLLEKAFEEINIDHRAVGVLENDEMAWFWIGSRKEYDLPYQEAKKYPEPSTPALGRTAAG